MKKASLMIREQVHYRQEAFHKGLEAIGYEVIRHAEPHPDNLYVCWNRYGINHEHALQYEKVGGKVIIAENGYWGSDDQNRQYYAMALNEHNGHGTWPHMDGQDISRLPVKMLTDIREWRTDGKHILVCPQRGIGHPGIAMPLPWPEDVKNRLRKITMRDIVVRPHPGNKPAETPLADQLRDAWAVVVWCSNSTTQALLHGIPVFFDAKHIVTEPGCFKGIESIESPDFTKVDRVRAFARMSWAQWSIAEIESGLAFKELLNG